jgi:hypothetical protein
MMKAYIDITCFFLQLSRQFHTENVQIHKTYSLEDQLVAKSVYFTCQPRRRLGCWFYPFMAI